MLTGLAGLAQAFERNGGVTGLCTTTAACSESRTPAPKVAGHLIFFGQSAMIVELLVRFTKGRP